jgi:hypothetical protein
MPVRRASSSKSKGPLLPPFVHLGVSSEVLDREDTCGPCHGASTSIGSNAYRDLRPRNASSLLLVPRFSSSWRQKPTKANLHER